MKKATRLICLIIAGVFILSIVLSIAMSAARAEEGGSSGEDGIIAEDGIRGETVYIDADAEGNPISVISSVYISNPDRAETVTDVTTLTDIKNIAGNETPIVDGETVTFNTGGEDVCYQGVASGELPFGVELSYYLDGIKLSPDEIAGKSGSVRIEVKTHNDLLRECVVDGETMELNVPFSVICMLSLDDSFTAVNADGAKVSAQAGQITVLAVLLPGLRESLGLGDTDRVRDSFTIEAEVEEFELASGMFIGMTGIVDENDLTGIDDIETLINALGDLSDASVALYNGSQELYYGMGEYADGVALYTDGVAQAASALGKISEGVGGAGEGAEAIAQGIWGITGGISKVYYGVTEAADALDELTDPNAEVDPALVDLVEGAVNDALHENADALEQQVWQAVHDALIEYGLGETIASGVADMVVAELDLSTVNVTVDDELVAAIRNSIVASDEVQSLVGQVDDLAAGLKALDEGASSLGVGADDLADGLEDLADGIATLYDAMDELSQNGDAVNKGAAGITRGLRRLSEGLKEMSGEGLEKIAAETDDLSVSLSRKDALLTLSDGYTSFSSSESAPGDSVQFMLTTEEIAMELPIETEEPEPTGGGEAAAEASAEAQEGFFARIGNWFTSLFEAVKGWFK